MRFNMFWKVVGVYDIGKGKVKITCRQSPMTEVKKRDAKYELQRKHLFLLLSDHVI